MSETEVESQAIQVVVRVRPKKSIDATNNDLITCSSTSIDCVFTHSTTTFTFNAVYGETTSQLRFFNSEIRPFLDQISPGINQTIFCYGITGAGKTFTMTGDVQTESARDRGIIPRTIQYLLQKFKKIEILISICELYNEKLYDLLKVDLTRTNNDLPIREDQSGAIVVPGLSMKKISTMSEFMTIFKTASTKRATAPTLLNKESSRSHYILTIYLTGFCKIHLIDLAGSEDNRQTGNTGKQLVESANINKSLFQLRKVVDSLHNNATNIKKQSHISYRDSKLTRLLQDSLGGKSKAILIANISTEEEHIAQTFKTLQFAAKAKSVINRVAPAMQDLAITKHDSEKAQKKAGSIGKDYPDDTKKKHTSSSFFQKKNNDLDSNVLERIERLEYAIRKETTPKIRVYEDPVSSNKQNSTERTTFKKRSRPKNFDSEDYNMEDISQKENIHPNKKKKQNSNLGAADIECKILPPSNTYADLLSPVSKHKEAKALLEKGNVYLSEKNYQKAFYYYNQASVLLPENERLQEKTKQIRKRANVFADKEVIIKFINECKPGDIFNLKGVGTKKGQKLLNMRAENLFQSTEDLCVPGLWSEKNIEQFISNNIQYCRNELGL
jgi:kinesin family protein 22